MAAGFLFFFLFYKLVQIKIKIYFKVDTVSGLANSARITKLSPLKEYKFRVRAVNKEGESPNLETSQSTLAKNPYDEPSAPGKPEIVDWDSVCFSLFKLKYDKTWFILF